MRILHTADLHLGQTFHSYDRTAEQGRCLESIEKAIAGSRPDAYLISGDVYHTAAPGTAAQEMFIRHLMNVHKASPRTRVVVTAGNHDSSRIEITDPLWNLVGVTVIGSIQRNMAEGEDNPEYHRELFGRHIITAGDEEAPAGYVVALPYCHPGNFPSVEEGLPREERGKRLIRMMLEEVSRRNTAGLPVVLMAHTAVRKASGADPDAFGQDLEIIGGIDMVDPEIFGQGYDYVALGHIHYPQDITGRIRYSGSPLPVSFDEDYRHSITLADIEKHGAVPIIREIPTVNVMPVITIPEQEHPGPRGWADAGEVRSVPWKEALEALENFPADRPGYLRLNVTDDGTIPAEARDIAAKTAAGRCLKAKFCLVNRVKKDTDQAGGTSSRTQLSAAQLGTMSPMQVAELFYRETTGDEFPQDLRTLLEDVIRDTATQNRMP